jgi:hypothetical protein
VRHASLVSVKPVDSLTRVLSRGVGFYETVNIIDRPNEVLIHKVIQLIEGFGDTAIKKKKSTNSRLLGGTC